MNWSCKKHNMLKKITAQKSTCGKINRLNRTGKICQWSKPRFIQPDNLDKGWIGYWPTWEATLAKSRSMSGSLISWDTFSKTKTYSCFTVWKRLNIKRKEPKTKVSTKVENLRIQTIIMRNRTTLTRKKTTRIRETSRMIWRPCSSILLANSCKILKTW